MSADPAESIPAGGRLDSVDFLRGIAMLGLVLVHSVLYFTPVNIDMDVIHVLFAYVLGDLGAAMFLTLVGASFVLSTRAQSRGGAVLAAAVVRGLFLIAVSMLLSVAITGADSIFEGDVLTLIGVSSIALALIRRWPSWALLVLAAVIVLIAPPVRAALGFLEWWGGSMAALEGLPIAGVLVHPIADYAPGLDAWAAMVGLISSSWFPLLPWLAFPIVGMVLGRGMRGDRRPTAIRWSVIGLGAMAVGVVVALLATSRGGTDPVTEHITVFSFTPDSTSLVAFQAGLVLLLLALAHGLMDGPVPMGRWMNPIRLVSRYALTTYVLSYLAIFVVIIFMDLIDQTRDHQHAVTTPGWAVLFGVLLAGIIVALLKVWDRHGGVGSLEWMLAHLRLRTRTARPARDRRPR